MKRDLEWSLSSLEELFPLRAPSRSSRLRVKKKKKGFHTKKTKGQSARRIGLPSCTFAFFASSCEEKEEEGFSREENEGTKCAKNWSPFVCLLFLHTKETKKRRHTKGEQFFAHFVPSSSSCENLLLLFLHTKETKKRRHTKGEQFFAHFVPSSS